MTPDEMREAAKRLRFGAEIETNLGIRASMRAGADALDRLADVIEYAERIAGSNRAESPFAVERVRHHDALSILRITRGETNEREGNEHSG